MDIPDAERQEWERRITADEKHAGTLLRDLHQSDHPTFLAVCRALAGSQIVAARRLGLKLLGFHGDRDDPIGEQAARSALDMPDLRREALLALGTVGTTAAFEVLIRYTEAGDSHALRPTLRQARTQEQKQQLLELVRQFVLSDAFYLRTNALYCLQRLSTPTQEEDLLVEAVRRHPDELIFGALSAASGRVLQALEAIRQQFRPGSAEYMDASRAIQAIEHGTDGT